MIVKPIHGYSEKIKKLPTEGIIHAFVTRMHETLSLLQDLDVDWKNQFKKNFMQFRIKNNNNYVILQIIISEKEMFVMLYDG